MSESYNISGNETRRVTRKQLIEAIIRTYPDEEYDGEIGDIAVVTSILDGGRKVIVQSITSGKPLKF